MEHRIPNHEEIESYIRHQLDNMWRKIVSEFSDAEYDDIRTIIKEEINYI
jgi:hypothetical protein